MAATLRPARSLAIFDMPSSPRLFAAARWSRFPGPGSCQQPHLRLASSIGKPRKNSRSAAGAPAPSGPMAKSAARSNMDLGPVQDKVGMVAPLTIIVPPINRIPRSPRDFFTYLWKTIRYKVMDLGGYLAFRLQSKGSLMKKPLFKLDRKGILPTAKALHRAFSEAVAAGDKTALRRVTTDNVYNQYADVIFRRPQSKRYRWELVRYNAQWRLPRIASHRIMPLPKSPQLPPAAIHQVVVTIACRQRLVELEETPKALARRRTRDGAVDDLPDIVEKSQKEADLTEHIVLTRLFNTKTYVTTDWKLAGTLGETSLEKIKEDEALIADMEQKEFTKSRA